MSEPEGCDRFAYEPIEIRDEEFDDRPRSLSTAVPLLRGHPHAGGVFGD
jgi:hypothetical protein